MRLKPVFLACILTVSLNSFGAQTQEPPEPATEQTHTALINTAAAQVNAGNYRTAESTLLRALTFQEKTAADSPAVALVLHNLGVCYTQLGRSVEAETALQRSLAITEKILGSDTI